MTDLKQTGRRFDVTFASFIWLLVFQDKESLQTELAASTESLSESKDKVREV